MAEEVSEVLAESSASTPETRGGNADVPEVKQIADPSDSPILMVPTPTGQVTAELLEVRVENVAAETGIEMAIVSYVEPQSDKGDGVKPARAIEGEKVSRNRKTPQTTSATTRKVVKEKWITIREPQEKDPGSK
ncbi:hypothetical protein Dimus_032080 [Dionaea muscipula]